MSCGKTLSWLNLFRCVVMCSLVENVLGCNSKISAQYFWVELVNGLLFGGLYWIFGLTDILPLYLVAASLLVLITAYDIGHKIIPDSLSCLLAGTALLSIFIRYGFLNTFTVGLWDFLGGIILFFFLQLFGSSQKENGWVLEMPNLLWG
jgi:prepilin signal peptidase PulO-like enzyme (type II secretory pathway)